MSRCQHTRRMFVPAEDDPELLLDLCLDCNALMGVCGPGDLAELGDDLGDPEDDDDQGAYEDLLDYEYDEDF